MQTTVDPIDDRGVAMPPLAARSLADQAYETIRTSILSGRSRMGERLLDAKVAGDLEVSRAVVREAFGRLAEEGLVVQRPRRGVFVRELGPRDVLDLYNVRLIVEPAAARLMVRRSAPTVELRAVVDRMEHGGFASVSEAESEFHTRLVAGSGNPHLLDVYRSIRGRLRMALGVENRTIEADVRMVASHHRSLVDAVDTGDEGAAARAAHAHIVNHVDGVLARLGVEPAELLAWASG